MIRLALLSAAFVATAVAAAPAKIAAPRVDVGRFDKNMQIPAHYGIKSRLAGVPAVLVVEPRSGQVPNAGKETALSDAPDR